jgi:hypothetical protein
LDHGDDHEIAGLEPGRNLRRRARLGLEGGDALGDAWL